MKMSSDATSMENVLEDMDEMRINAAPTDLFEKVRRKIEIAEIKEIYSRDYMISHKLCTPEEYDSIAASTSRRDALRRARDWGKLSGQVFGAEY